MQRSSLQATAAAVAALVASVAAAGCHAAPPPPATQAPAPPAAAPAAAVVAAQPAAATPSAADSGVRRGYTAADVRFMQGMIHHHAQALAMTALVPARTTREEMRPLAQRIEVSQRDEIGLMRRWLLDHHESAPSLDALVAMHDPQRGAGRDSASGMGHDMHAMTTGAGGGASGAMAMAAMPGMLSAEEMARLARASGTEFDRLFLQFMIRHHEGALKMVADLFAAPGAGQDAEVFRFAADVDADQRAEIARMRSLLAKLPNG